MRMRLLLAPALAAASAPATAQPLSLRDSFPIGSGGGVLCSAQSRATDPALESMFDRGYDIACRDAAAAVGRAYVLRSGDDGDPAERLARLRRGEVACGAAGRLTVEGLGAVETLSCSLVGADVGYRVYQLRRGNRLYAAEGLAGYDSALRLALRSLVADAPADGIVEVATTGAGDPAAFARVQAGSLGPSQALAEAYRRNNAGDYAEAAEFFAAAHEAGAGAGSGEAEALVNQALQQSNLGATGEAEALFARAAATAGGDPIVARMLRNYRAIHFLNQQLPQAAMAELDKPLPAPAAASPGAEAPAIDAATAALLNAESGGGFARATLRPEERVEILEGQALHLRGTLLRIDGRHAEAESALRAALDRLAAVREGRVVTTIWMRAQILSELAAVAEARGDAGEAESRHQAAIALLETWHPGSAALRNAKGRFAGFHARAGRVEPALALFREVVETSGGAASPSLRRTLAPYFALLAARPEDPASVPDLFKASQLLVRPGVAQTQAVLARELSGGSDEASRLFRQSVDLARDIERLRAARARLGPEGDPVQAATLSEEIERLEQAQVATQAKLAEFPRYRVVAGGAMDLAELQAALRPGEAYYKMIMAGEAGYGLFVTPGAARAFPIGAGASALERDVDALRATISVVEDGQVLTYPFDVARAHRLFGTLFGPVAAELAATRHLIFEPDGAMLRLPPNLLVTDEAGVRAYLARAARPGDDGFDFTGIAWLGRGRDISTAVSPRAFRDVRQVAPSGAAKGYLGFGQNAPPQAATVAESAVRDLLGEGPDCTWPIMAWARPIPADELRLAGRLVERGAGAEADIVTGAAFTDSAISERGDLSDYRILHFATHGLVTAPRPECPARPALMTSFGGQGSDGLLSFAEIYDLRLDADLVILSACDTAGKASLAATREAGIRTGGDFALDGLVRAFVGAGGRSVVASHWPVPEDFDATGRLISGLFTAPPGTSTAAALRSAQTALMDSPDTSHPYYWSGFAIVGDGALPVLRAE